MATDRNYKVGDVLVFDSSTANGQYERVFNSTYKIKDERLCDYIYNRVNNKFFNKLKKDDLYDIAHKLEGYDVIVKELAIEEVRRKLFSEFPSRFHCMYLSQNKTTALKNIKNFASLPGRDNMINVLLIHAFYLQFFVSPLLLCFYLPLSAGPK